MSDDEELYALGKQLRLSIERLAILDGLGCTRNRVEGILVEIEKTPELQLIQCPRRGCREITNTLAQQSKKVKFVGEWICSGCGHSFPPSKWIWLQPGPAPEKEIV